MKRLILFFTLLISSVFMYAQTTYYWVGGTTGTSGSNFATGLNWNTNINGTGTTRTTPTGANTDILIVDGTNIGGLTPTTGTVTIKVSGSSTILISSQLKVVNNGSLVLQRVTSGTATITLNGDTGDDFVVDATSSLTLTGTAPSPDSSSVKIQLGASATGRVSGTFSLVNWGSRIITGGALFFESGSICNVNTYEAGSYPFGSISSGSVANSVVFNAGSKLYYKGGNSIFSNTSGAVPIYFNTGSELIIDASIPNNYCSSSNYFSGRRFSNVVVSAGRTIDVDNFINIDNLKIQAGATMKLKTTGAFPVSGNIINDGVFKVNTLTPNFSGTSNLMLKGSTPQTIEGIGLYDTLGIITVGANANVILNTDLKLYGLNSSGTTVNTASIVGTLDLNSHVISGTAKLQTREAATATTAVVTGTSGLNTLSLDPLAYSSTVNTANVSIGLLVTGTGIPANTYIIGTSSGTSTITLSNNNISAVSSVTISNNVATLKTSNVNGIDGSLLLTGGLSLGTGTNYEFNGTTSSPFSLSTNNITGNVVCNAAIKSNKSQSIGGVLTLNSGNFTIRSLDTIRLRTPYNIGGEPFSNVKHIVNEMNAGSIGILRMDSISSKMLLPIGSVANYLPLTLSYTNPTNLYVSVFEGITQDGSLTGTPLNSTELQKAVNAIWNITPTSSLAIADSIKLEWPQSLEGSSFTTLTGSDIGVIKNDGISWGQPLSVGDNTFNTASLLNATSGIYSIGSLSQSIVNNFIFDTIPTKTYGDADFSDTASSPNTTQPIIYTSSNTAVATISSAGLIHIVGAGSTNITAAQLSDGVYTDTSITRAFIVNQANLTITANDITRNEGVANPTLTATYSGFVNSEDSAVLLTPAVLNTSAIISSPVGTYPVTLSGATAANYVINFINGTLTVQSVVGAFIFNTIGTKTYGDADFSNIASSLNTGQLIVYSSSNTSVATISSAGLIHIAGAGSTDITASQASDGIYPAASVTRTLVVNKADLTITANDITRNEGVSNPTLTATYSGFVNGEDSTVLLTPTILSTSAIVSSPSGDYPITVSGATAANYTITFVSGTLSIQAAPGAFTFNTISTKTYGDGDFSNPASSQNTTQTITYSSSNTAVATISSAGLIHITGAGTTDITASQASDGTYPAASVTRTFVVNKKGLTITANNISRNEGVSNPTFSATYSGFVNGEDSSVLLTPAVLNTSAIISSPTGTYPIIVSGATSANYSITFVNGTLTVQSVAGAFTFNTISTKTYGDADFSNIASSLNTGQSITYSSSNTSVATISSAGLIHIVGAGTTDITASQASDGTYPAASVTRTFVVNKKGLTITANDLSRNEGVSNPTLTATYSGFVNGEDSAVLLTPVVLNTTAIISSPAGNYPITVSGATASNYSITLVNGTLTVQSVAGAFTFNTISTKTYGDADFSNIASSLNTGQSITYSSSNTSVATISSAGLIHIVGAGTTDITASQATDGIYPAASVTRTFVVNKKGLTITANNITRNEGVANPALTVTYSGFVNGEDSTVLQTAAVVSTLAIQSSPAGIYSITVSAAIAANYNITFVAGTLTVVGIPTTGFITYYWVGGTGSVQAPSSFSTGSKWNTRLDETGVARPTGDTTGILIFDGSNIGGATPATGDVFVYTGSTRMSQLILRNGANVTLSRITTGNGTISIKGDSTVAEDILINSGCSFTMNAADSVSATSGNKLLITPNATGIIYGSFTLNGGTCRVEQTNPVVGGAMIFENGSTCNVNTQVTYYPFGSSNGVNKGVVFRNGSKLVYKGGKSFYRASSSSIIPIVLEKGNICRFEASVPNIYSDSSLFFSNRTFSNVEIAANVSVNADDFYNVDNLTIETGATFNLKGSGTSPVSGSILNNGTFGAVSGFTSSVLLMKGNALQTIGGTGVFNPLGALVVAAGSNVELNANLTLNGTANSIVHGKLNLKNSTITGTGTLQTKAAATVSSAVTTATVGTRVLTLPSITGIYTGMFVTGNGISAGSYVIGSSSSASTITISESVQSTVSSIEVSGSIPVIETSNANGVDGSIGGVGLLSLTSSTDYIFDGATSQPFSLLSPSTARNVTINAAVTTNKSQNIDSTLTLGSGILTIRPTDTIRIKNGNDIGGAPFSASKYIITQNDGFNIGVLRVDFSDGNKFYPVGTSAHYLPARINTTSGSTINASVFEGVTNNGELTGTALNNNQLQSLVNAVWKLNRTSGSGNADVELSWDATLEGALFTAASSPLIGVIQNSNNIWGTPFGTGDNNTNTVVANVSALGSFSIGANDNNSPFVFNPIPTKTYGDTDFNTSLYSSNTTQPVIYTSSNPAVATVSTAGLIHIVGAGTTDITADQASDGVNPVASITRTLLVNKASLTITANDKNKYQGDVNPLLTTVYSGFVNGEDSTVLLTPVSVNTSSTTVSPVGIYPIIVSGATAANYNITFVNGTLTILSQLNISPIPSRIYGSTPRAFNTTVTSINTQPIIYSSSNISVATIDSLGKIYIVGAGTTDITVSQASDGTYPAATSSATFVVDKAPLNIKLVDTSRIEGQVNPSFRYIYTNFVYNENESVLNVLPYGNTIASRLSTPGVYVVTPDGAQAANYSLTYTSGLLKVYPKDITQQVFNAYYSNGAINVKVFSPEADLSDILLYSIKGQFMMRKNIFVINGFTSAKMDINNIASGNYVLIYKGKKIKLSKIITIIK